MKSTLAITGINLLSHLSTEQNTTVKTCMPPELKQTVVVALAPLINWTVMNTHIMNNANTQNCNKMSNWDLISLFVLSEIYIENNLLFSFRYCMRQRN